MDIEKLLNIINDTQNKSNKDLLDAEIFLFEEFEKTKKLALELTNHMDMVQELYIKITKEIDKRKV